MREKILEPLGFYVFMGAVGFALWLSVVAIQEHFTPGEDVSGYGELVEAVLLKKIDRLELEIEALELRVAALEEEVSSGQTVESVREANWKDNRAPSR